MATDIEIAVIGGGPAGLGAAIEAAKAGAEVVLFDENRLPGGQLFKQIHKFFGSNNHYAGTRGFAIGKMLLEEAARAGVRIELEAKVLGKLEQNILAVLIKDQVRTYRAKAVIIAAGAKENALHFPGWTLPGVMTAGAAQTFINIHRVKPGSRALVVGSGNVGLIVAYQLCQAGIQVAGIVEAKPSLGGYQVHAAKIARLGIPVWTGYTVRAARGAGRVEQVELAAVEGVAAPAQNVPEQVAVDLVCLAVGLTPRIELAKHYRCALAFQPVLGGFLPLHNAEMETTVPNVFTAGDTAGVEEASSALEEGRIAGLAAAKRLHYLTPGEAEEELRRLWLSLEALRAGTPERQDAKRKIIGEGAGYGRSTALL